MVRLNEGGQTGRDFFLLPPDVHLQFTGLINRTIAIELEPYRYPDVWDLMHALRKLRPEEGQGLADSGQREYGR